MMSRREMMECGVLKQRPKLDRFCQYKRVFGNSDGRLRWDFYRFCLQELGYDLSEADSVSKEALYTLVCKEVEKIAGNRLNRIYRQWKKGLVEAAKK